jgi:protein-S-isoprenylcysteine O-methyltransferase Ste14
MKVPSIPHIVLLFFLGGVFIHFFYAGARTFYADSREDGPGPAISQGAFFFGGLLPIWLLGLYQPIHLPNGIVAACLLATSIALYEWARATIWGRRFGIGWGQHVPEELCELGPYRRVRHPLYLSYLLAFAASFVALPHWITGSMVLASIALFTHAAQSDERRIAESPLAGQYAEYRQRVGMFFPRVSSAAPGKSTP